MPEKMENFGLADPKCQEMKKWHSSVRGVTILPPANYTGYVV